MTVSSPTGEIAALGNARVSILSDGDELTF